MCWGWALLVLALVVVHEVCIDGGDFVFGVDFGSLRFCSFGSSCLFVVAFYAGFILGVCFCDGILLLSHLLASLLGSFGVRFWAKQ